MGLRKEEFGRFDVLPLSQQQSARVGRAYLWTLISYWIRLNRIAVRIITDTLRKLFASKTVTVQL